MRKSGIRNNRNRKSNNIIAAIISAEKFTAAAAAWLQRLESGDNVNRATKEGGAAKRASMELTRVLAEMRRP